MNHILFSPAFAQLTAPMVSVAAASPSGGRSGGDACYHEVSIVRSGAKPLVFQGQLLIDDCDAHGGLKLYETDELELVCLFEPGPSRGPCSQRVLHASTAEELAIELGRLDPLRLVDVTVSDEASPADALHQLHARIEAVRTALMRLSHILNVDVSDAIARLAALCDGDQTWLQ
jgi:hypothetical protein